MGILDKLDKIEVNADQRISEQDLMYCETQQQAYDESRMALADMKRRWNAAIKAQREILGGSSSNSDTALIYLRNYGNISSSEFKERLEGLHDILIDTIIRYFNRTYHVSVSSELIRDALLPARPERGWRRDEESEKQYHKALQTLALSYNDIVDHIIIQLNGQSFSECALEELKRKCHTAAWNTYQKKPDYEVKKDIVRLISYACSCDNRWNGEKWTLRDSSKDILRGIAHYETGEYGFLPAGLGRLFEYNGVGYPLIEFSTCDKLKQIRMFKNGRMDIKFANAQFASAFAEQYLGLVC
ncbi:MAG: hypothetical protein PHY23_00325 [Oscillospiraceae bacterium]|nr:hypothetical protein [Oscillospiraceae bacterium]